MVILVHILISKFSLKYSKKQSLHEVKSKYKYKIGYCTMLLHYANALC